MTIRPRLLLATLGGLLLASCSGDSTVCATDSDCFADEACARGACVAAGPSADAGGASDTGSTALPDGASSPTDAGADAESDTDVGSEPVDAAAQPDGAAPSSCVVDPFDVAPCPDDENDRFAERFVAQTVGCQDDGFVALDETRSERLCALESADRYSVSIIECDVSRVLEITFTPLVSCPEDAPNFDFSIQGKKCAEQDLSPDVECAWQADGSYLARFIVEAGRSIALARIDIDAEPRTDIDLPYDLRVELR